MGESLTSWGARVISVFDVSQALEVARQVQALTEVRPIVALEARPFTSMPKPAPTIIAFPADRAEAPAARLALASILATGRQTQLEVARCGVNVRRAVAGLKAMKPREGAPSPIKAIKEIQKACSACGACRGI